MPAFHFELILPCHFFLPRCNAKILYFFFYWYLNIVEEDCQAPNSSCKTYLTIWIQRELWSWSEWIIIVWQLFGLSPWVCGPNTKGPEIDKTFIIFFVKWSAGILCKVKIIFSKRSTILNIYCDIITHWMGFIVLTIYPLMPIFSRFDVTLYSFVQVDVRKRRHFL